MDAKQIRNYETATVALDQVEMGPGPFCMSFAFDQESLRHSISRIGLLNQPFLAKGQGDGKMHIVAGYRRILVCKSLGMKAVRSAILHHDAFPPLDCLRIALYDNLATRKLNDVEKGMILSRLLIHTDQDELLQHYMPLLGLPGRRSMLDYFLRLEALDPETKTSIALGRLSPQSVRLLFDLSQAEQKSLAGWIDKLMLSANYQKQLIDFIIDISIRDGISISDLLAEPPFTQGSEKGSVNPPQRAKEILDHLRTRRFPRLVQAERAFQRALSHLTLPKGVRIRQPSNFEGPGYSMEISFKDGPGLLQKIEALQSSHDLTLIGIQGRQKQ